MVREVQDAAMVARNSAFYGKYSASAAAARASASTLLVSRSIREFCASFVQLPDHGVKRRKKAAKDGDIEHELDNDIAVVPEDADFEDHLPLPELVNIDDQGPLVDAPSEGDGGLNSIPRRSNTSEYIEVERLRAAVLSATPGSRASASCCQNNNRP